MLGLRGMQGAGSGTLYKLLMPAPNFTKLRAAGATATPPSASFCMSWLPSGSSFEQLYRALKERCGCCVGSSEEGEGCSVGTCRDGAWCGSSSFSWSQYVPVSAAGCD